MKDYGTLLKPYTRNIQTTYKNNGKLETQTVQVVTLRKRSKDYFHSALREALIKSISKRIFNEER
ncbi:MAG: hypothetical protein PHO33_03835 [Clostridia bacterium]|nr:hypothetical protein [Clostridia bacterium]